mmetsp:Transcript_4505/g.11596  ORF Transcript_4505/g.11596 Transcript_4505/m.11596 type:complete len:207 (-) Transcript_4505:199-819(-)
MPMWSSIALVASASAFVPRPTTTTTGRLGAFSDPGFCDGLPGSLPPTGQWDPLGLTEGRSSGEIRRYREAETQHGRVAMLAVVGFLVAESYHPLFADVKGPAIDHLTQVRKEYPAFFEIGALFIGVLETNRALQGWAFPDSRRVVNTLKDDYYPGDVGFDPLGLKPQDKDEFDAMVTRELQNGRLAMIAMMGFFSESLLPDSVPLL